jgi:hypothetical protein
MDKSFIEVTSVIRWEDPPPRRANGRGSTLQHDCEVLADDLRKHPGKWALCFEGLGKTGGGSHVKYLKAIGCEAVRRKVGNESLVWARWPR